jgi:hypothetical protein
LTMMTLPATMGPLCFHKGTSRPGLLAMFRVDG